MDFVGATRQSPLSARVDQVGSPLRIDIKKESR